MALVGAGLAGDLWVAGVILAGLVVWVVVGPSDKPVARLERLITAMRGSSRASARSERP